MFLDDSNERRAIIFGSMQPISGIDGYQKSFEDNQWDRREALEPSINIESIFATQALAMGLLMQRSRTRMRVKPGDKKRGFAVLNNSETDQSQIYDGSSEEYMACRVAKVAFDQWRMRIRFRQNELTHEKRNISYIDDYSFDWLRNGNLQAWYGNFKVEKTDIGTLESWSDVHPLGEYEMIDLRARMGNIVEDAKLEGRP